MFGGPPFCRVLHLLTFPHQPVLLCHRRRLQLQLQGCSVGSDLCQYRFPLIANCDYVSYQCRCVLRSVESSVKQQESCPHVCRRKLPSDQQSPPVRPPFRSSFSPPIRAPVRSADHSSVRVSMRPPDRSPFFPSVRPLRSAPPVRPSARVDPPTRASTFLCIEH